MGGRGSGKRPNLQASELVDDFRQIDIRKLIRTGYLLPGQTRDIVWNCNGKVVGRVRIVVERDVVWLAYTARNGGLPAKDLCYPVSLESTACHLGGRRQWFLCPVKTCGRRVAILYGGQFFICRHCRKLAYPSQREDTTDRVARRTNKIRERLGWTEGILNPRGWQKPKGMHWRTFELLVASERTHCQRALNGLGELLGLVGKDGQRRQ